MLKTATSKTKSSLEYFSVSIIRGLGYHISLFSYYVEWMSYQRNNSYGFILCDKLKIKICEVN